MMRPPSLAPATPPARVVPPPPPPPPRARTQGKRTREAEQRLLRSKNMQQKRQEDSSNNPSEKTPVTRADESHVAGWSDAAVIAVPGDTLPPTFLITESSINHNNSSSSNGSSRPATTTTTLPGAIHIPGWRRRSRLVVPMAMIILRMMTPRNLQNPSRRREKQSGTMMILPRLYSWLIQQQQHQSAVVSK
jgi:hypothetical protein